MMICFHKVESFLAITPTDVIVVFLQRDHVSTKNPTCKDYNFISTLNDTTNFAFDLHDILVNTHYIFYPKKGLWFMNIGNDDFQFRQFLELFLLLANFAFVGVGLTTITPNSRF
jgi:hypothetical protein